MRDVRVALGLAIGGPVIGSIVAPITRKWMSQRPQEAIRESAKSTGSFLFVLHDGPLAFERAAQRRPDPDPAGA